MGKQGDAELCSNHLRLTSGSDRVTLIQFKPRLFKSVLPWSAFQPSDAVKSRTSERVDIPESGPSASAQRSNRHRSDGNDEDTVLGVSPSLRKSNSHREQEKRCQKDENAHVEDEGRDSCNTDNVPAGRQLSCDVAGADEGSRVRINDVTFLRIDDRRETDRGTKYVCVGWFLADSGLPTGPLRDYKRKAVRMERLATLRSWKRTMRATGEWDAREAAPQKKKAKRARNCHLYLGKVASAPSPEILKRLEKGTECLVAQA